MNINLRHSDDDVEFNVESDIDVDGKERICISGGRLYFSLNIKEADELCEKLKQCLMDVELSKLFNKSIKLGN